MKGEVSDSQACVVKWFSITSCSNALARTPMFVYKKQQAQDLHNNTNQDILHSTT